MSLCVFDLFPDVLCLGPDRIQGSIWLWWSASLPHGGPLIIVLGGHQPQGMSYSSHVVSKLLLFRDSTQPLMKLHGLVVEVNELLLVIVALKLVQGKPGL